MAYGARLESVLGASPRGFESPILRHRTPGPLQVPGFLLPVAPLVFRAPSGPAPVCAAGRRPAREPSAPRASLGASSRSPARPRHRPRAPQPGPASKPARALRSLRRPPHRRRLRCRRVAWRVVSKPGQAPPPPTGTAARHATAHGHYGLVDAAIVRPALSHAIPPSLFQYLNWHRWNCNVSGLC